MIDSIEYYKVGDPNTPAGLRLYIKNSKEEVRTGVHGEEKISREEFLELTRRFSDPLTPRTETGAFLTPEAAQKMWDDEEEEERRLQEEMDGRADFFARKMRKEMELGIIQEKDVSFYISINRFSSELREKIIQKLQSNEVPNG